MKNYIRHSIIVTLISYLSLLPSISQTLEKNKEVLVKGNEKYAFEVPLKQGEFLQLHVAQKDVDIQVLALSPQKDTLETFNDNSNELEVVEQLASTDGTYIFEISPYIPKRLTDSTRQNYINNIEGSYKITDYMILSEKEYNDKLIFEKAQQDSVISWIKKESITLKGVKAETGLQDFSDLKEILKDKKVIGLGETSHGTKEIFQMKHRFLEFLVKELDFRIFAIEASNIGCRPINDYVLYGKGTSREALSSQGFWVWDTEEVIDMIEWMRTYNASVSDDKKVQFLGMDTQMNALDAAYQNVQAYTDKINTELIGVQIDSLFKKLNTTEYIPDFKPEREKLYSLLSYLILNEQRLINITAKSEYDSVIYDLKKIIQGVESNDDELQANTSFNIRDEYMAQTILEILQNKASNNKVMVWAHNGHISKDPKEKANGYIRPLGSVLKEYLGDQYYAIGFSTYKGSFQGLNYVVKDQNYSGIESFTLAPADVGSIDWYFAQSQKNILFIDLNKSTIPYAITHTFLNKDLYCYSAGAGWSLDYTTKPIRKRKVGKAFDGVIFIKETSSAHLTPNGTNKIQKRLQAIANE